MRTLREPAQPGKLRARGEPVVVRPAYANLASFIRGEWIMRNIVIGLIFCIGGILVTALTYSAASGGGRYVIAWGAIVFGAIQFIRGLTQLGSSA